MGARVHASAFASSLTTEGAFPRTTCADVRCVYARWCARATLLFDLEAQVIIEAVRPSIQPFSSSTFVSLIHAI